MLSYIFELPAIFSFFNFIFIGILLYLSGRFFLHILSNHAKHDERSIPIGTFMGTISTAWALSLGFVAADIWVVNATANHATSEERSSIARMLGSSSIDVLNSDHLTSLIKDYQKTVTEKEWIENKNTMPSSEVDIILQKIRREIFLLAKTDIPSTIISQIVQDFDELQDARNTRLSVGATSVDMYKWYLLISLTILTIITISAVHADKERAGIKAIIIYSITSSFCLWILAIHANPYQGAEPLQPNLLVTHIH